MSEATTLLAANGITLLAQLLNLYSSTRKNKNDILIWQCVFMALITAASYLLKGYSAVVTDILSIIRNLIIIKGISNRTVDYIQMILCVILGVYFNSNALLGYLPIIASISHSVILLNRNVSTAHVQMVNIFSSLCWTVFNLGIRSYVGALFNAIAAVSFLRTMLKSRQN